MLAVFPHRHQHCADWIWRLYALVVGLPCVGSIMRHELQVLDTDRLVLQLGHRVVHALLPRCNVILLSWWGRRQLIPQWGKHLLKYWWSPVLLLCLVDTPMASTWKSYIAGFFNYHSHKVFRKLYLWTWGCGHRELMRFLVDAPMIASVAAMLLSFFSYCINKLSDDNTPTAFYSRGLNFNVWNKQKWRQKIKKIAEKY